MKKKFYFLTVFIFLSIISFVFAACTPGNPCCCQTSPSSGQRRCYNSGICCNVGNSNEYWDPESCYNFEINIEGSGLFIAGQPNFINLYIKNIGAYTDSYNISTVISSSNPQLIILEVPNEVLHVIPGETRVVKPRITILSTTVTGEINFTAISRAYSSRQRSAVFTILRSDLPYNLPEFNNILFLLIVISSTIIYYIKKKHIE